MARHGKTLGGGLGSFSPNGRHGRPNADDDHGPNYVVLRLYSRGESALKGTWKPPSVEPVK
jgi:hypothetical protein